MTNPRGKTALFQQHGPYLVFVHSREPPLDAEWNAFLDEIRSRMQVGRSRILVYTDGGAPNARQRAMLNELLAGPKPPIAIVTPSPVARAVGTALGWFQPRIAVFKPDELEKAFAHLDVASADQRILTDIMSGLRRELTNLSGAAPQSVQRPG